jgi:DNA repair ATPase RecN
LNESERITEIAQLMSGTDINEAALVNARALMNQ